MTIKITRCARILLFTFLASLVLGPLCGQVVLDKPLTENTDIKAYSRIVLKSGFRTNGFKFHASILTESASFTLAPPANTNYMISLTPQVASTDPSVNRATFLTGTSNIGQVKVNIGYFDGLGRPMQSIDVKASPLMCDVINTSVYDQFGRETTKYLPYVKAGNNNGMPYTVADEATNALRKNFYDNTTGNGSYAFSQATFEKSPLERVLEQGAPGSAWQPADASGSSAGHTQKYEYGFGINHSMLDVRGDFVGPLQCTYSQFYKSVVKDENYTTGNLHTYEEYNDIDGRTVLKVSYVTDADGVTVDKLETRYLYDDFGNLRFVIPPKAAEQLYSKKDYYPFPISKDSVMIKSLCYYYDYDSRHRMTVKHLPGAEPVYMVYDKRDRLVLTQDGKMRDEDPKK